MNLRSNEEHNFSSNTKLAVATPQIFDSIDAFNYEAPSSTNSELLRGVLTENMKALKVAKESYDANWNSISSVNVLLSTYRTLKISHVENLIAGLDDESINEAIKSCTAFALDNPLVVESQAAALKNLITRSEASLEAMNMALSEGVDLSGFMVNRLCKMIADETYVLAKLHQLKKVIEETH